MKWMMMAAVALGVAASSPGDPCSAPDPACCYFSALDKDVQQPGQKAFLTWDPVEQVESFTVQPMFQGNAKDFGMVVPTPGRPRLQEAHRDFFKMLAVFTILKPMNVKKFKGFMRFRRGGGVGPGAPPAPSASAVEYKSVKVLETGVVGSLDYKILEASDADGLFAWLKQNGYVYSGDTETLDFYIQQKWFFTVMRIDPQQMKRDARGNYTGEVTPTRFTFESPRLIYPLKITQISVKDKTDALFYIQAPSKMDFPEPFSYQFSFQSMWTQAFQWADWSLCTETESAWWAHMKERAAALQQQVANWRRDHPGSTLSTLEYSRRLTPEDLLVLTGERPFDRAAPAEEVKKLRALRGILKSGQFLTKCRHVFRKGEMEKDLVFAEASFAGRQDAVEHIEILPTSPP